MAEIRRLSDKILSSFERHQRELAEQQKLTDSTMKELLEQRERFARACLPLVMCRMHLVRG